MSLVGFLDLESTGTSVENDRIVEIALKVDDLDTRVQRFSYRRLIDPGVRISAKVVAIHGITDADVMGAHRFEAIAPVLAPLLAKLEWLVIHNGEHFDAPMLLHEFIRAGVKITTFPKVFDTMLKGRDATPDGKIPSLGELCWAFDVPYDTDEAHGALYDVEIMAQCFYRGLELGVFSLAEPLAVAA